MNWKETYTKIFLKELGKSTSDATVREYLPLWWMNTRNKEKSGLRLTEAGFDVVNEIDLTTYEILYPQEMTITAQVVIFLDNLIDCPYYLTKKSITVTNERKAVELTLFAGDIRKYGLNKALKRPTEKT